MKKSNILIAVFAVIVAAVSAAKAGDIVDFDGKGGVSGFSVSLAGVRAEMVSGAFNSDYAKQQGQNFKELTRYYLAQAKIKEAVASYYRVNNNEAAAAALSSKDVRIGADGGVVYVVRSNEVVKINDPALATTIVNIVQPQGQQKIAGFVAGAAYVTGCMLSDSCWGAVGDGVSAVSEAVSEYVYSHHGNYPG